MPQLSIELTPHITACVHYYYARPYFIDHYRQGENRYRIIYNNGDSPLFFPDQDSVKEFLKRDIKIAPPVSSKASLFKVVFLQRKYKKRAMELSSLEMQTIQKAVEALPEMVFTDADTLFEFCIPDLEY